MYGSPRVRGKGMGWSTGGRRALATAFLAALLGPGPAWASESVGSVTGSVVLTGDVPRLARLPVTKHRSVCGESKHSEDLVVSPSRGVANVVVTIEGVPRAHGIPQEPAVLDNRDCVFVPHVLVAAVGQVIEIRNSDGIIHTAHAYDEARQTLFNVALPVYKRLVRRTLTHPGIYRIVCDVGHTWMSAYVVVLGHPYAAVTDGSGRFRIPGVPPGIYRLRFWHERLGVREEPLVIRAGGEATVNLAWRVDGAAATGSRPPLAVPIERAP